ncbi:MAG TPA: hypothetical protein VFI78_02685 [Salinimicrobium sp.]|nr:hypothetical protein [Salinimicrobium sp.]
MKNTLKIALILIGLGFGLYGLYQLIFPEEASKPNPQLYAMIGVGLLFLLAGTAMKKR